MLFSENEGNTVMLDGPVNLVCLSAQSAVDVAHTSRRLLRYFIASQISVFSINPCTPSTSPNSVSYNIILLVI